jgi:hypothetical protein
MRLDTFGVGPILNGQVEDWGEVLVPFRDVYSYWQEVWRLVIETDVSPGR